MNEDKPDLRTDIPHGARIWNYWLGGKDNYAADRAVGDAVRSAYPSIPDYAVKSRQFLARAVRYLATEAGVRQFLDVGAGLPTMQNTHEVAQDAEPSARVLYVDNDPLVLAHARALLTGSTETGHTGYLDADYTDPAAILAGAAEALDLTQPVAVMCMGIFGYLERAEDAGTIVARLMEPLAAGSHLALWDGTDTSEAARTAARAQADMGSPYALRTVAEIAAWFGDLDLVDPGLVPVTQWRPDLSGDEPPAPIDAYGGVARKP